MKLDKINVLKTGISLKISTAALQEMIAKIVKGHKMPELENVRSTADLYDFLCVVVYQGAAGLVKRRSDWISQKNKANLIAAKPVPFQEFCNLFWRSLDEDDPDGDEWNRLIADDSFNLQLSALLNQLRVAIEHQYHENEKFTTDLNFGSI